MSSGSSDVAVVIPSNRQIGTDCVRFIPDDIPIFIVNDGSTPIIATRPNMMVFDREFVGSVLGKDADLIPRGSAACRNFGFYYVWRHTACRRIVSIDDDVVTGPEFLDAYGLLGDTRQLQSAVGSRWFNPVSLLGGAGGLYARGFPFEERGNDRHTWQSTTARIVAHMGLWDTTLDTHAIDKLLFLDYRTERRSLPVRHEVVRIGATHQPVFFPLSSMNFGFLRELCPIMYQFPMVDTFTDRFSLWRFDDIWAGYLAQTLIAKRGDAITVGAPVVRHLKQGDLHAEFRGEHYGVLLSPYLYAVVDAAAEDVQNGSYLDMYASLCDAVLTHGPGRGGLAVPSLFWKYIEDVFRMLQRWIRICGAGR